LRRDKKLQMKCILCGKFVKKADHHKIYRSRGGGDEPENKLPVCWRCHDMHHRGWCGRTGQKIAFDKDLNCLADCLNSDPCPWKEEIVKEQKTIKCQRCGQQVDIRKKLCPNCGAVIILLQTKNEK